MKKKLTIILSFLIGIFAVSKLYTADDLLTASGSIMNPGQIGVSALADSMRTLNLDNYYVLRSGDSTLTGDWDAGSKHIRVDSLFVDNAIGIGTTTTSGVLDVRGGTSWFRGNMYLENIYPLNSCSQYNSIWAGEGRFNTIKGNCNSSTIMTFDASGVTIPSLNTTSIKPNTISATSYIRSCTNLQSSDSLFMGGTWPDCIGSGGYLEHSYAIDPTSGTDGQVLTMQGTGIATWKDASGGGIAIGDAVSSGTAGSVLFVDGSGNLGQDNSNFYWDDANNRLGIGTTSPNSKLHIISSGNTSSTSGLKIVDSDGNNILHARDDGRIKIHKSADTSISKTLDIAGNVNFDIVNNPTNTEMNNITATENLGGGTLAAGEYYYDICFITDEGETAARNNPSYIPSITVSLNSSVTLDNLPLSTDPRVTGRRIFRSNPGGGGYSTYSIAVINDNTTTSFEDTGFAVDTSIKAYRKVNTTAGIIYSDNVKVLSVSDPYIVSIGYGSLRNNISGNSIISIGPYALENNTTGNTNTAIGYRALCNNTTGYRNVGINYGALYNNTTGNNNIAIGGFYVMKNNTSGSYNIGIGQNSLNSTQTGNYNVAIGYKSGIGSSLISIDSNTFCGSLSGYSANGGNNSMFGMYSGYSATSSNNSLFGYKSGYNITTGGNNLILGYNVYAPSATASNQLNIGNLIFSQGIDGTGTTISSGNIGIGVTNPSEKLTVEWATGVDAGFFRGTTDTDITGTFMRSPNGTLYYTWVDDTGAFQSSITKP